MPFLHTHNHTFQHDISHFAFVFELALNHRMDVNGKGWPRLLLRVTSDDEWGRHYVEGYASLALPTLPGRQTIRASCWRPRPMDNVDRLREYFIGQAVDLPGIESCSLDNTKPFETESSGQIEVTIETMLQSRLLVSLEAQKKAQYASIMRRIGLDTDLHWKIMKVLMEFEEAKRRLLLVKKKTNL